MTTPNFRKDMNEQDHLRIAGSSVKIATFTLENNSALSCEVEHSQSL